MQDNSLIENIKKYLFINDKLNKHSCKEIYYYKSNLTWLLNDIKKNTYFLDQYNPILKERIFYIQNDLKNLQKCKYCVNKTIYDKNKVKLSITCNKKECLKKQKSEISHSMWNREDQSYRKSIVYEKECLGCKNKFVTKKETKKYCSQPCFTKHNNKKQSIETILKRVESTKKTVNTDTYKNKRKENPKIISANKIISEKMKQKILLGEFTPCITNSWTKWVSFINIDNKIKKFRSNWEAAFWLLNSETQYETIRIPYIIENQQHSYIVDFEDKKNKIIYEIKPSSLKNNDINNIKIKAAINWCNKMEYKFTIIDNEWFENNAHKIDYEKHPQLYKSMKQFLCK
jgi:hypothetical protein